MTDPIGQMKDLLDIEDSDEQKKHDIKQKQAEDQITDRERLELREIKEKEKQQKESEES